MRVKLPANFRSAVSEAGGIAALLDKNGWRAAAFIAVSVGTSRGQVTPKRFAAEIKAKGWSAEVVERHYDAWQAAADRGMVPHAEDLRYGERIELPTEGWSAFYPPSIESDPRFNMPDKQAIIDQARADGTGANKALDIAKNTKAMSAAIIGSPKVQEAAAKALVDAHAVKLLASATAAAAQNQRVERNRNAANRGDPKPVHVGDPGPKLSPFLTVSGLAEALRALVTTFPAEWSNLSDEARYDEDFQEVCLETLEQISTAVEHCKAMVQGIDAAELADLLGGAQ